jgi:transcription elongation factor Elf1
LIDKCPNCGEELTYDEVDIGVGVQRGNYRCDNCGWNEPFMLDELHKLFKESRDTK